MKLSQLNKLNTEAVTKTQEASTYQENLAVFRQYNKPCEEYRNALLKSLAGKRVKITGYVTAEHKKGNYTLTCVTVEYNGAVVDTLHHLNVYQDLVTRGYSWIGGTRVNHEGNYGYHQVKNAAAEGVENNTPPSQCLEVTCEGIVYSYGSKWSVGTARQVAYAAGR